MPDVWRPGVALTDASITIAGVSDGIHIGFELDRQYHWLRGDMDSSKQRALTTLARVFAERNVAYAIIGGVAFQLRSRDPRTTRDIAVALLDGESLPRAALEAAGFRRTGVFDHSENWVGPDATPIQFSDDEFFASAVQNAERIDLDGVALYVVRTLDLLRTKLRAATAPERRASKRLRDMADVTELLEDEPALEQELTAAERALLPPTR